MSNNIGSTLSNSERPFRNTSCSAEHFPVLPVLAHLKWRTERFAKFWAGKEKNPKQRNTPRLNILSLCVAFVHCCRCEIMVPPPLLFVPRGAMPAHQRDFLAPADTTNVGTAVDVNFCRIVLANGIILSAESAGMDESRFCSHFNENKQICCASGQKCENPCPVEESSHHCEGCGLLFHSELMCGTKKLSKLAGADGFTKAMLPPYGQAKYAQYKGVGYIALLDVCYSCQERIVSAKTRQTRHFRGGNF